MFRFVGLDFCQNFSIKNMVHKLHIGPFDFVFETTGLTGLSQLASAICITLTLIWINLDEKPLNRPPSDYAKYLLYAYTFAFDERLFKFQKIYFRQRKVCQLSDETVVLCLAVAFKLAALFSAGAYELDVRLRCGFNCTHEDLLASNFLVLGVTMHLLHYVIDVFSAITFVSCWFRSVPEEVVQRQPIHRDSVTEIKAEQCVICMVNARKVCLPCGHYCLCLNCYSNMLLSKQCPLCRATYSKGIKVF